jgi:hypothetical protein
VMAGQQSVWHYQIGSFVSQCVSIVRQFVYASFNHIFCNFTDIFESLDQKISI